MPYLSMQTNKELNTSQINDFLQRASKTVTELLAKPESYVMVAQPATTPMLFSGSADPCAYVCLKSLNFPEQRTAEISAALCELVADCFDIDPLRIYLEFTSPPRHMWGWNNTTF